MREDTEQPLYRRASARSLTQLASAYLIEPRIAERLTAVWIGGPGVSGHRRRRPAALVAEYNLNIDITAAQVVFNDSPIGLWQVPRNAYRQTLMSWAELQTRVRPLGELGAYLYRHIDAVHELGAQHGFTFGETYIAGDNPLVLLTALQSSFEADPSSRHVRRCRAPAIDDDGG